MIRVYQVEISCSGKRTCHGRIRKAEVAINIVRDPRGNIEYYVKEVTWLGRSSKNGDDQLETRAVTFALDQARKEMKTSNVPRETIES